MQPSGLPLSEKIQEKPMAVIESTSPEKKGEKLSGRVLRGMPDEELLAYAKNTINEEKISKMDKLACKYSALYKELSKRGMRDKIGLETHKRVKGRYRRLGEMDDDAVLLPVRGEGGRPG